MPVLSNGDKRKEQERHDRVREAKQSVGRQELSRLDSLTLAIWRKAQVTLRSPALHTHPNLHQ